MNEKLNIEEKVHDFILTAQGPFSAEECAVAISGKMPASAKDRTKLIRAVERELKGLNVVFRDPDRKFFQTRASFFNGGSFLIIPDAFEIEKGILFAGDRLTPFCSEDVFPSDALLINEQNGREFEVSEFTAPLNDVMPFHILLGSEQVFDYFIADHENNESLFNSGTPDGDVTLDVFDFSEFYAENNFIPGDAVLLRIDSWANASFSCSFVSGSSRIAAAEKWIQSFNAAMEQVIDYFENYLEIPEQVSWAYFLGDRKLLQSPGSSVREFIDLSDNISIIYSGGHTVLGVRGSDDDDSSPPLIAPPEGIMVSSGETEDLELILKEIQSPLNIIEIESYCCSELWRRQLDFDAFFKRCFGQEKLSFADDVQEAAFLNFIEDIWERGVAVYNANLDEVKAPVREQVLELVDARVQWFEFILSLNIDPAVLDQEAIQQMKELSLHLTNTLNMLNDPSQELSVEDAETLVEAIASVGDMLQTCLERLAPA